MLPAPHRLTGAADFSAVVRRGARAGRPTLVVHLLLPDGEARADLSDESSAELDRGPVRPTRVGFVVSKAVGGSVVRHRVTRRLRAICADQLGTLPVGTSLVVRARPDSSGASFDQLRADLVDALGSVLRKAALA